MDNSISTWPTKRKIAFIVLLLIVFSIVGFVTINEFFNEGDSISDKLAAAMSIALILVLAFIPVLPTIHGWLKPNKPLSDEQVSTALTKLAQARENLDNKEFEKAVRFATDVIIELPKKAEAYRVRARALEELGKIPSALEDYNQAISLEPGHPFVHCFRAKLYQQIGDYEKAVPDMLKCLALAPDLPGQLFQMADTLFLVGEFDKASQFFQKVLEHSQTKEKEKEMATEYLKRIESMKKVQEEYDESEFQIQRRK